MKISCVVNRIEVNALNVGGSVAPTPIVKLVPMDSIGDFYFAVPGGEVTFNAEDEVIEKKNDQGFVIDRKITVPKGTQPVAVKAPSGAVFTAGEKITVDLTPTA